MEWPHAVVRERAGHLLHGALGQPDDGVSSFGVELLERISVSRLRPGLRLCLRVEHAGIAYARHIHLRAPA